MTDSKPTVKRTYETETTATAGLRLVKDTPPQPTRAGESLSESATGAPRDLVERLMERIKRI